MDNALKFTPRAGKITLSLKAEKNDVKVTISDTGPGIKSSDQVHIFERYRRGERSKSEDGNGLGLAIVKKILDLHNSSIQLISKPNKGCSFEFTLQGYAA